MTTIREAEEAVAAKVAKHASLTEEAKNLGEEIYRERLSIGTRVRSGETTGDSLHDYILIYYPYTDQAAEERYRAIEAAFKDHEGEFVLVHYLENVCTKHVSFPTRDSQNEYELRDCFACGVLAGEKLLLGISYSFPQVMLPVVGFVSGWVRNIHKSDGPLREDHASGAKFKLQESEHVRPDEHTSVLIVGDAAVKAWFEKQDKDWWFDDGNPFLELHDKCAEMLGKLILTPEHAA